MQAQTCARILAQACILLALLLAMVTMAAGSRPASHKPPSPSHASDPTITLYTTGATPPTAAAAHSRHPIFASHGPTGHHSGTSWPRVLAQPGAVRPGTVVVVDEQFRGKKEFGLPLDGKLQGVLVAGLNDSNSRMVAVKAMFAGGGGDSLRFFGVHHDGQKESHVAVVGGTGRYDGATGFAVVGAAETGGNFSLSNALSFRVHLK